MHENRIGKVASEENEVKAVFFEEKGCILEVEYYFE
jgi:hypothetical protein